MASLKQKLSDRYWRLNNLYKIVDAYGNETTFKVNEAQEMLLKNFSYLNLILKARQLGFTTLTCLLFLDVCLFNSNCHAGVIAHTRDDAEEFFNNKIKFAYQRLPDELRERIRAEEDRSNKLSFSNGSALVVGTSLRGGTYQYLHISEFGKICSRWPDKAREIVTGALNTLHQGSHVVIESTAEGREGYFHDYVMAAKRQGDADKPLGALDFRLHFFPWWQHAGYQLDPDEVLVLPEHLEYFSELRHKHGIKLTARQKAWWIAKYRQQGEDIYREFPATVEEAFRASIQGAYYERQMTEMRKLGRISKVPVEKGLPVHVGFDLGMGDENALVFAQVFGKEPRLVDYYENSGEDLEHYAGVMRDKGYHYGTVYLPHDATVRSLNDKMDRTDTLKKYGVKNLVVVPRTSDRMSGIEQVRQFLGIAWVDAEHCNKLVKCLDEYRKEWDDRHGCYKQTPLHNWASNGADSLRTLVCGLQMTQNRSGTNTGAGVTAPGGFF